MSPILGSRGISPRSYGFAGAGKPNAPVSVSATDVGTARAYNNGAATVSFTSGGDNGAPISSFTATSSPGGFTASGSSSPLTVTGLQSSVSYTFTVTATNSVGTSDASSASSAITATTIPQPVTIGTATCATGQAYTGSANVSVPFTVGGTGGKTVTYTATSSSSNTGNNTASPITVSETVGNPTSTARTYTVVASNANGSAAASSASNSVAAISVPQAPTIGTPTPSTTSVSVAFTANATGGASVSTFTATGSPSGSATNSASPINVTGLTSGTSYTFTVTATNASGTSSSSGVSASVVPGYYGGGWTAATVFSGGARRWTAGAFDNVNNRYGSLARVGTGSSQPNIVAYSNDGVTWSSNSLPITQSMNAGMWFSQQGNSQTMALNGQGTGDMMRSGNMATWTQIGTSISDWNQIQGGNNTTAAWVVGRSSTLSSIVTINDSWSTTARTVTQGSAIWNKVGFNPTLNMYVALSGPTNQANAYSTNGITWATGVPSGIVNGDAGHQILSHKSVFINVGAGNATYNYSTNGTTWNTGTLPGAISFQGIASNGTVALLTGEYAGDAYTSTNGITWTTISLAPGGQPWGYAVMGATSGTYAGRFVGLPYDTNQFYYSTT